MRLGRQSFDALTKAFLDAPRELTHARRREPTSQLRCRQATWQLQYGQGISLRLGDQAIEHGLIHVHRQHRG